MSKILVLMSTYNGEKYLIEQIESILSQKDVNVSILVRDDGSTDLTKCILEDYQNKGLLKWYAGENVRPAKSFLDLVMNADLEKFDFFAFSDQDDIWLPEKLRSALKMMNGIQEPALYYGKTNNVTAELDHIDYFFRSGRYTNSYYMSLLCGSLIPGCTIVFNKKLMCFLKKYKPGFISMHDNWVHLVCLAIGGRVFGDKNAYILYRQHENNAIGSKNKGFCYRIKRFVNYDNEFSKMANELLKGYCNNMSDNYRLFTANVVSYQKSLRSKLNLIDSGRNYLSDKKQYFLFVLKVLFNKF